MLCTSMAVESVLAQQLLTRDSEKIGFAQDLLNKAQYKLAASEYEEFIQQYPQSAFLPNAYLGGGDSYFFLQDYNKAIGFYQQYAQQFPQGKDKWLDLLRWGQCLYLIGEKDDALAKLTGINAATVQAPFVQTFYFYLGLVYMDQKNSQQAAINFEKATQAQVNGGYTLQAYLRWGDALTMQADYTNAIDKYTKALELSDSKEMSAEIIMKEAQAHFLEQDYNGAAKLFNMVIRDYPSLPVAKDATVSWFSVLLESQQQDKLIIYYDQQFKDNFQDPAFARVHLLAVEAFLKQGKQNEAMAILDKLIAVPSLAEKAKAQASFKKAEILVNSGKFTDAVAFIKSQKSLDKDTKVSMMLLEAQSQVELRNYDKAWAIYSSISQGSPDEPAVYCDMAHLRYVQGKFDEAASLFMECFHKSQEGPSRQEALYNVFLTYQKANKDEKAIEVAESYRKQYPQGQRIPELILALAGIYSKNQKYDQAIDVLKILLDKPDDPHWPEAVFQKAYNLQLSGKDDEAISTYEQITQKNINHELKFFALKNSAIIYLQKKDEEKAAQALDWIVLNFPSNDLPIKDYLWLAQYWQTKNAPQRMLNVLLTAQKHPVQASEDLGIKFLSAEAYRLQNNCPQSLDRYDEVIAVKENNPYKGLAYLGKGMCLASKGDKSGAQKAFEQAIAQNLEDNTVTMRARFELARLAESRQDFKQAAKLYMMVAILYKDPQYAPQALWQAGGLLQRLNDNQGARGAYQQILDDYPQSSQAGKAKEIIEKHK